jgi:hypothetical protein
MSVSNVSVGEGGMAEEVVSAWDLRTYYAFWRALEYPCTVSKPGKRDARAALGYIYIVIFFLEIKD